MERFIDRCAPRLYAALRIIAGLMFATHGCQKLFGWPGKNPPVALTSLTGAAGVIELLAGILIAIGLRTRCAAFVASGQMAFAYFMVHAPRGFFPSLNMGELAVLYCFLFLYIAAHGADCWSVDELLGRSGGRQKEDLGGPATV
jgi:putative oxidoreductase